MDELQSEVKGLTTYTHPQPRVVYAFVSSECRSMDGRLLSAMYMVGGNQWYIGPGGEEW